MKVSIIGLGWLGQGLADELLAKGYEVAGTTRSTEKQKRLIQSGIDTYLFDLFESEPEKQLPLSLFKDAIVIVNIAPGRRDLSNQLATAKGDRAESFQSRMLSLIEYAIASKSLHLCFVSTTSVFGSQDGRLAEKSQLSPETASGRAHAFIEKQAISNHPNKTSVLRLAGLIGHDQDGALRHPVTSLSKRERIENGDQVVNLVHRDDVITALIRIISRAENKADDHDLDNTVFQLCSTEHPTREDYYTWAADTLNLPRPNFVKDDEAESAQITSQGKKSKTLGKIIDATFTLNCLGIDLRYPSPYDMLKK
uniref:NAD-dependent epimerase/dehydratase family protein n=1 Tax=Ningiella ruwaisensis TaxID=2364274 RepID=UPI0014482015|nr:NAD-dependent epimerase/dehydratase family protein [Ningiella ruwaisensis]